ncbi:hypothetical protein ACI65C_004744 [Semiaphis heraclei]
MQQWAADQAADSQLQQLISGTATSSLRLQPRVSHDGVISVARSGDLSPDVVIFDTTWMSESDGYNTEEEKRRHLTKKRKLNFDQKYNKLWEN